MSGPRDPAEVTYGAWSPDPRRRRTDHLRRLGCPHCARLVGRQAASTIANPTLRPGATWLDADLALDQAQSARRGRPIYERARGAGGRPPRPRLELTTIRRADGNGHTVWRPRGPRPGEAERDPRGRTIWCRQQANPPCEVRCACGAWLLLSSPHPSERDAQFPVTPATFVVDDLGPAGRRRKRPAEPAPEFFDNFSHVVSARPKRGTRRR